MMATYDEHDTLECQLGARPTRGTGAQRAARMPELALQLVELIDQLGPAGRSTGGR